MLQVTFPWKAMMTNHDDYDSLVAHLYDLEEKSNTWHKTMHSSFLNEEEIAYVSKMFPPSNHIQYVGGYPEARKKKIVFLYDEEDDFFDITCISARVDQRFRKISHRDILGALMHLQIDRHSFGDFWIDEDHIYLYTNESMARFLIDNLTRINQLSVHFHEIQEHPSQVFHTRRMTAIIASERIDALVAGIAHISRSKAKEMIQQGLVQVNHITLEAGDKMCDNNDTISIRGYGRFKYLGVIKQTRSNRILAEIEVSI